VNPHTVGNGGEVFANGAARHGLDHSAALTLPANAILVFARRCRLERTVGAAS
jgi:1,4-alpha-glucan branching enzyme